MMNVVFMNSLERGALELGGDAARVTIGENQGTWMVLWDNPDAEGQDDSEVWYEGTAWEDMLVAFRLGLQAKRKEGYIPLIEDMGAISNHDRAVRTSLLQYYAELNRKEELYQELRAWRLDKSGKDGKTPFIIATNRTLEMICAYVPHTIEELRQIPGMSANRVSLYGDELIRMTGKHLQAKPFPLDWVEAEVSPVDLERWNYTQQEAKTRAAVKKQAGKRQLLEGIAAGEGLDELLKRLSVVRRDLIGWIEELEQEGYDVEPVIEKELGKISAAEAGLAEQAFREEGYRYLKPIMQKIYDKEQQQAIDMDHTYSWLRLLRLRLKRSDAVTDVQSNAG
jgi:hypothetical protein